jgi:hypothetical protein
MEYIKYELPPEGVPISRRDYQNLADHVNHALIRISENKADVDLVEKRILKDLAQYNEDLKIAHKLLSDSLKKYSKLKKNQDSFYSRQIELFGVFIAIFSFIIAGIQLSTKAQGGFWQMVQYSSAIFLPITASIAILLLVLRWIRN